MTGVCVMRTAFHSMQNDEGSKAGSLVTEQLDRDGDK
jgi:hypothetical protein